MKIRGIIFDLDGTLIDSKNLVFDAYRHAFRTFTGREFTDEEIQSFLGPNEKGVIKRVVPDNWQACLRVFLDYEREHIDSVKTFDGIHLMLDSLSETDLRLAIVTGRGNYHISLLLSHCGLAQYFDIVKSGSEGGSTKSSAIRSIAAIWNEPLEHVAYVGDHVDDMVAAEDAGVIPIWVLWSAKGDESSMGSPTNVAKFYNTNDFLQWIRNQDT